MRTMMMTMTMTMMMMMFSRGSWLAVEKYSKETDRHAKKAKATTTLSNRTLSTKGRQYRQQSPLVCWPIGAGGN